jgi:hypothetical protein
MRYITLNESNEVVAVRYGASIVEGEIESEGGKLGQKLEKDKGFVDVKKEAKVIILSQLDRIEEKIDALLSKLGK